MGRPDNSPLYFDATGSQPSFNRGKLGAVAESVDFGALVSIDLDPHDIAEAKRDQLFAHV